jgi:apolipoprotein N-acyltransferase
VWLVSVALLIANSGLMLLLGVIRPALLAPALLAPALLARAAVPAARAAVAPLRRRVALAAAGVGAFVLAAGAGPLAFALTPAFPTVRQATVALVQPGVISDPAQSVDASETLTREFSTGGVLEKDHPDLIVWGESSDAYDLAADPALLSGIEQLSAQDQTEILSTRTPRSPGRTAARRRSASWSARRASRAVT